ncbi:MAG: hypothetical protein IPG61_18245 [bacterium]|nr:hypothetical protein [bacterium]
MSGNDPQTLTDLLRALERSGDLRTLARECGLSVRELRRRLAIWRRELQAEHEPEEFAAEGPALNDRLQASAPEPFDAVDETPVSPAGHEGAGWPPLPAALTLSRSPPAHAGPPGARDLH